MSESYSELLVAKNPTLMEGVGKFLIVGFTIFFGILGVFLHPLLLILCGVGVGLCFYLLPKLSVEYEYLYVNKELDIDKIYSKEQRKKAMSIDLDTLEVLAPVESHQLDQYKNRNEMKTYDFTSRGKDIKFYEMILTRDNGLQRILLELDQRMLNDIKQQFPRKVFTD